MARRAAPHRQPAGVAARAPLLSDPESHARLNFRSQGPSPPRMPGTQLVSAHAHGGGRLPARQLLGVGTASGRD
jgi:hypothetical protein